ncbi:amidohydrolase family protein [Pantoea ananatis]|nr:amidohydrolase family protein [Pantoea ananatis]MCW1774726.1 amidohydrolase family protein [Pantoea ananatis]UYK93060.1 amidohydrolase family protein [Pantoea ananatis]
MDKIGIKIYILSLNQPGIEAIIDTERAVDMAKRMNDYCAKQLIDKHPDRLRAFACVPMQYPHQAATELERTVKNHGFVGALINGYTNFGDENTVQYLDEPQVDVFWSKVEELGVPVYLHPRIPMPSQQRIYKGYEGLFGSAWEFGVETSTHAVRLMLSGLFDRQEVRTISWTLRISAYNTIICCSNFLPANKQSIYKYLTLVALVSWPMPQQSFCSSFCA